VELPLDTGELVEKALDKARDDEVLAIPDLADTSWSARQADAFVNLLGAYLSDNNSGAHGNDKTWSRCTLTSPHSPAARGALPCRLNRLSGCAVTARRL